MDKIRDFISSGLNRLHSLTKSSKSDKTLSGRSVTSNPTLNEKLQKIDLAAKEKLKMFATTIKQTFKESWSKAVSYVKTVNNKLEQHFSSKKSDTESPSASKWERFKATVMKIDRAIERMVSPKKTSVMLDERDSDFKPFDVYKRDDEQYVGDQSDELRKEIEQLQNKTRNELKDQEELKEQEKWGKEQEEEW